MGKLNNRKTISALILAVLVLGGVVFSTKGRIAERFQGHALVSWYAVHLANNQVYFGHITSVTDSTITLADTYFLESYQEPAPKAVSKNFALEQTPKQSVRLVRRGDEKILSSDHTLFVNRSAVLYWEKLTPESEIANLLKEAK